MSASLNDDASTLRIHSSSWALSFVRSTGLVVLGFEVEVEVDPSPTGAVLDDGVVPTAEVNAVFTARASASRSDELGA